MPEPRQFDLKIRPEICYFGVYDNRGSLVPFGIKRDDRRRHMYILGKTGMGKSTFLQNMCIQDIYNGEGVCFIDPHGEAAEYIMDRVPSYRQNDVIYFDPSDTSFPIGFNMLEQQSGEEKFLVASGMMAVFTKLWAGMWSTRMEYILNNCILALLDSPGNTLLGITRMLTDKAFRNKIVSKVTDPIVKNFWLTEFAGFNDRYKQEAIAPIQNKIGQFLSSNLIRNMVGQPKSGIDMRQIMDQKKILIINLSKGRLGEDSSSLLGGLLITKLQLAAMSRVNMPESERSDFYMYVDEFQNFTTDSFATILSEARKYRLNLVLAHQYIAQLTEGGSTKIKNAVFGNVGTMICFRVGSEDSEILEREFAPVFTSQHLQNLNARQTVLKLSIDNASAGPFLAETLPPIFEKMGGRLAVGLKVSRERYGSPVERVEDGINRWLNNQSPSINPISKNTDKTDLDQNFDEIPDLPSIDNVEGGINQNPEWKPISSWEELENSPQANLDVPAPKKKRRRKKKSTSSSNTSETDNEEVDEDESTQDSDNIQKENIQNQPIRHPLMDKLELLKKKGANPAVNLYQPTQNTQPQPVTSKQYFAGGLATSFAINEYQNDDEDGFEIPVSR
jgi:hypothetical protein